MSPEGPRITGADIAEASQIVRDVAILALTEPEWAAVSVAVSAIADALAHDDPEALHEVLADLEMLGPTRLAAGNEGRVSSPAPHRIEMLLRILERGPVQTEQEVVPVAVYVSDTVAHEQVEAAVEALLDSAGLTIVERDTPVLGSWFRRMRAAGSRATHSPATREAVTSIVGAADAWLSRPEAEVTAILMQNLGAVISALQPTKDAVVRVGTVLVVKVEWTVVVHQLTPGQRLLLDHNPGLESAPHSILAALGALDGKGEGKSQAAMYPAAAEPSRPSSP